MADDYCAYAAAVNLGRAIPRVDDGLKPVQRRIVYTMHDMGLDFDKPFKKSARVEGEVMGKLHPNGGSYGAMVNLANSWANRYALLDGQGNWGTTSDGAAAARYTEVRLNQYCQSVFTSNLDKAWVDHKPNYDGSLEEPVSLPARLPALLLRDTSGIGVAAACRHVSYNLKQVAQLSIAAIKSHGTLAPDKALAFVTQADFAMGGQVVFDDGMRNAIVTGQGTIRLYGTVELDEANRQLVCTELPQDVSPETVLNQTFDMLKSEHNSLDRKVLADARDESDRSGTRVVWELTAKAWAQGKAGWLLHMLHRHTDLQTTVSVNAVSVDVEGCGYKLRGVAEVANEWAKQRRSTELRRVAHLLKTAEAKIELLDGMLTALDNIAKVAQALIDGKPLTELGLGLTDSQSDAIEDMPLRSLRAKNRAKLAEQLAQLKTDVVSYTGLANSDEAMTVWLCNDIKSIAAQFGDKLRTKQYSEPEWVADSVAKAKQELEASRAAQGRGYLIDNLEHVYGRGTGPSKTLPSFKLPHSTELGVAAVLSDGKLYWLPATAIVRDHKALPIKLLLSTYGKALPPTAKVLWSAVIDRADKKQLKSTVLLLTNTDKKGKAIAKRMTLECLAEITTRKKSLWVGEAAEAKLATGADKLVPLAKHFWDKLS
jgi:DNA gyrase subunit A